MPTETFQTLLGADLQVSFGGDIVSRDAFPQETIRSRWIGDLESINLDICERVGFLEVGAGVIVTGQGTRTRGRRDAQILLPCVSAHALSRVL